MAMKKEYREILAKIPDDKRTSSALWRRRYRALESR